MELPLINFPFAKHTMPTTSIVSIFFITFLLSCYFKLTKVYKVQGETSNKQLFWREHLISCQREKTEEIKGVFYTSGQNRDFVKTSHNCETALSSGGPNGTCLDLSRSMSNGHCPSPQSLVRFRDTLSLSIQGPKSLDQV